MFSASDKANRPLNSGPYMPFQDKEMSSRTIPRASTIVNGNW